MSVEEYRKEIESHLTNGRGKEEAKLLMANVTDDDIEYYMRIQIEPNVAALAIALGI